MTSSDIMPRPNVSVIIPCYNHAAYITDCLDSVLAQTYRPIEVVLIDDGSSDDSYELAQAWAHRNADCLPRIHVATRPNRGLTATLNELLDEARGDMLALLASDDRLLPDGISEQVAVLRNDEQATAVFADAEVIDAHGRPLHRSALFCFRSLSRTAMTSEDLMPWEVILRWPLVGSTLLCRRDVFDVHVGIGRFDESKGAEDRDLFLRLLASGGLRFLDRPVADYRVHGENTRESPERKLEALLAAARSDAEHARLFPAWKRFALRVTAARRRLAARRVRTHRHMTWTARARLRITIFLFFRILWLHDLRIERAKRRQPAASRRTRS